MPDILGAVGFAYIFGAGLGVLWLGGLLAVGARPPDWPWWGYVIAPLAIVAAYMACELAGAPVHRVLIEPDKLDDERWKRALRFLGLIGFGCGWIALLVAIGRFIA